MADKTDGAGKFWRYKTRLIDASNGREREVEGVVEAADPKEVHNFIGTMAMSTGSYPETKSIVETTEDVEYCRDANSNQAVERRYRAKDMPPKSSSYDTSNVPGSVDELLIVGVAGKGYHWKEEDSFAKHLRDAKAAD